MADRAPSTIADASPHHSAGAEDYPPLLDLAVPTVYRTNAFRMIGLRADASARDVARRSERLRMAEKLGQTAPAEGPLPLDPPPGSDAIRDALQRLRDPEHRLVEEIFWFWPVESSVHSDAALTALAAGDTTTAIQIWRDHPGVGSHNLAVLFHAAALDLELSATPLPQDAERRRDRCWRESFASWKAAIESEDFWARLHLRIRGLQDPRLTAETGLRIRAALPRTLLAINARLAVSAADRGSLGDRARHVTCISDSGFGAPAAGQAIRAALAPLRQRVMTMCQSAPADAEKAPEQANQVANRLLDSTASLLAAFTLLGESDPMRESAHDEVALSALSCQIAYGNKTEDWDVSLALLERILTVAISTSARARVQRNLEIIRQNIDVRREVGTCFFCNDRKAVDGQEVEVKMHGNVTRTPTFRGTQVQWSTLTVKVPRCATCKKSNASGDIRHVLIFLACAIAGFSSCGAVGVDSGGFLLGIGGLIAGGVVGSVAKRAVLRGVKPLSAANDFPAVLRRKQEGWSLGEKPAGVQ